MNYVFLEGTDSTNTYVCEHAADLGDMTMVVAHRQRAGRGQRGNSWESEPGKNITATLFVRDMGAAAPGHPLAELQFAISEATALAVADTLHDFGIEASVKWPNDVYVGDSKIAGILIEHSLTGSAMEHTRIGIGLNVNQRQFHSDAPNPISMARIKDEDLDMALVLVRLSEHLERRLGVLRDDPDCRHARHQEYLGRLWRADGSAYPWRLRDGGTLIAAAIDTVLPDGRLRLAATQLPPFRFKEIEAILAPPRP